PGQRRHHQQTTGACPPLCDRTARVAALAGNHPPAATGIQESISVSRFSRIAHPADLHSPVRQHPPGRLGWPHPAEPNRPPEDRPQSVNQLHAMIRDLLEATRADSGKLRIEPRCIDIGELVRQAITMMQPTAAEKHVGLEAELDPTVPLVYADPDRALEVLINLIDNGIKFTPPEGSVVVKASMVETDPGSVYLSVRDSGRGIPAESLQLVFERLFQDPDAVD